jgi:GNAT superfamily N-acetyltransferase
VTRDEAVQRADLNYAEAQREFTRRAGGVVLEEGGVLCFAGGHSMPVLMNGVMRIDPGVPAEEVLDRARRFFRVHRRGFSVLARGAADADLDAAAEAAGFVAMGDAPGMVLRERSLDPAVPPGITVRRVATTADVAAFAEVQAEAYATYGMPKDVAPAVFARLESAVAPHIVAFVALAGDAPVAGAMTIVTHGVSGVYWVGTVPAARGRGLAALVTTLAANAGFDLGAQMGALQASIMGEPVYRRLGWVEVTRYPYRTQFAPPA